MTKLSVDAMALLGTIELIVEAGFDRLRWPDALQAIAALMEAPVAVLCARRARSDVGGSDWGVVASVGVTRAESESWSQWMPLDALVRGDARTVSGPPDIRDIRREDWQEPPFLAGLVHRFALDLGISVSSGEQEGITLILWHTTPTPFVTAMRRALLRMWPHLVRSLSLLARDWEPSRSAASGWAEELLEHWPVGIVSLCAGGSIRHANRMAREMADAKDGFGLAFDGPVAFTATDTRCLRLLIRAMAHRDSQEDEWLRLTRPSGRRPYEVALRRTPALSAVPHGVAMLLADPEQRPAVCPRALQTLHKLTPVEADVARRLVQGGNVDGIAADLDLSVKTTRWYVEQLREKLGARSQTEIVRLILTGAVPVAHMRGRPSTGREN